MSSPAHSASDIAFYENYYSDGSQTKWREVGAQTKASHVEQMCRDVPHSSVLEVGMGEGAVLSELWRRGFGQVLHGVEISASGVRAASERKIPRVASVQLYDGTTLPFPDKSVDLVYATHVLEHVEHERLFLRELKRVGRLIFLEVPLEDNFRVSGFIHNTIGHINFYNRHTFRGLVDNIGLEIIRFESFNTQFAQTTFHGANVKNISKALIRSVTHRISQSLAERILVFNGAILAR